MGGGEGLRNEEWCSSTQGNFDRCVCARRGQTRRGAQDEAVDAPLATRGGEGGEAGRGERAEGQDGGARRGEVCQHLAGGDEELLQIQPVLSAAA